MPNGEELPFVRSCRVESSYNCKNYIGGLVCLAFMDGIPSDIVTGENPHEKPTPDQDNDIVFEEKLYDLDSNVMVLPVE